MLVLLGIASVVQFKVPVKEKAVQIKDVLVGAQISSNDTQIEYTFGVIDIPLERPGAASSSTGYEFGHLMFTSATAMSVASTSSGFAVTMNGGGYIKACAFDLQTLPTTGSVSIMIQKNGTLITTKFCRLPNTGTFAVNGGLDDVSKEEILDDGEVTFVAGDRIGIIASSSNLNAATIDGTAEILIEIED